MCFELDISLFSSDDESLLDSTERETVCLSPPRGAIYTPQLSDELFIIDDRALDS